MTSTTSEGSDWVRVIRVDYGSALVAAPGGAVAVRTREALAVGDWVSLATGSEFAIAAVAPRSTQLTRRDANGLLQVLAANVDLVFVTVPADRAHLARAEREVAIGWDSGATPVVLLTKADLVDGALEADLRDRLLGVEVIAVSSLRDEDVERIRALLRPDRTAVLLGPSGAGKSTLVNALIGWTVMATGAVRDGDHRGRHTTTTRELHAVPGGGFLIDTPGLRALSLAIDAEALDVTFPEIAALATECRFRDCSHTSEPGCAVLEAEAAGTLHHERLLSYRKLQKDLAYQLRRDDPLAAQADKALWRQRSMDARRFFRDRGQH